MFQPGAFPRLPFYDVRLADFFATVPSAWHRGRRLQVDYLKHSVPELARVPWQAYDANLYWYPYFRTWLLPKRAVKKAWRLLRRRPTRERNWEMQFLNERAGAGWRSGCYGRGYGCTSSSPRRSYAGCSTPSSPRRYERARATRCR